MQKHFDFKKQAQVRFQPSFLLFCLMASGETKSLYVRPWCTWAALLPCISMSHHLLWMKKSRNLELLRALWQALSRLTVSRRELIQVSKYRLKLGHSVFLESWLDGLVFGGRGQWQCITEVSGSTNISNFPLEKWNLLI